MSTSNLEGARCVGQWDLFDQTDIHSHREALKLCEVCPMVAACRDVLEQTREAATGGRWGGPRGTWGGMLIGVTRSSSCGSVAGYHRHRRANTQVCIDCLNAKRRYDRDLKRANRAIKRTAECGTDGGYFKHQRARETACEACKRAHREYERQRSLRAKASAA